MAIDERSGMPELAESSETSERQREQLLHLGVATLHEAAGKIGCLPVQIRCMTPGLRLAGPALTVSGPPVDNLWLHRAVYECAPGDILVAVVGGVYDAGYWGEVLSWAAKMRGLGGVVIDGCVRDYDRLSEVGVPVFARGLCMRGTTKRADGDGSINAAITIGDVVVSPGDYIIGDADGVLALPADRIDEVIQLAIERERYEIEAIEALRSGATTLEIYGLPPLVSSDGQGPHRL